MPHQIPQYLKGTFVSTDDGPIPIEDFIPSTTDDVPKGETGIFARLSAPGYLDATEWSGPFDTIEEAHDHIRETYEVDPETGEDTTTLELESIEQSAFFPSNGILQQSNRQALESHCDDVTYDEKNGTITVDAASAPKARELIESTTDYLILDEEDYYNRERELKEAAIADLPIGRWLDKIQGHGDHVDAFDAHNEPRRRVGPDTKHTLIDRLHALTQAGTDDGPSAIVSDLLVRFEESMSEYNDGWNGSQIDYSEDRLFGYFEQAVEAIGLERARTILGFYDADPDTTLRDAAERVVNTFESLYGPATLDIGDSPDVEKMRQVIMALRDAT